MFRVGGQVIYKPLRGRLLSQETTENSSFIVSLLVNADRSFSSAIRPSGLLHDLFNHPNSHNVKPDPPEPAVRKTSPPEPVVRKKNSHNVKPDPPEPAVQKTSPPEPVVREKNSPVQKKIPPILAIRKTNHPKCKPYRHIKDIVPSVYSSDEDTNLLEEIKHEFDTKKKNNPVLKQLVDIYRKHQKGTDNNDKFAAFPEMPLPPADDLDEIFRKMKETRLVPNVVAMVNALCKDGLAQEAIKLFGLMHEKGTIPEVITYTAVVEGYCKAQKLDDAIRIFRKMQSKGVTPNAHSYGILIQWLCKVKRVDDAVEFCGEMIEAGHSPNTVTFMGLVDRFCREKGLEEAQKMIISLRQKGFYIDEHSCREYLEKKGPSPPQVWEAVLGKKPSHIRSLTSLFHYE